MLAEKPNVQPNSGLLQALYHTTSVWWWTAPPPPTSPFLIFYLFFPFPNFYFFSSFPPSPLVLICIYDGFLKFPLAVLWVGPYIHSHLNSLVFHYFLIGTAREEDERWSFYAQLLHIISLVSTAQMETYIYTWEAMELGWGESLENDHLNQQPVVAGLLVVK